MSGASMEIPELNFYGMGMDIAYTDCPDHVVAYLLGIERIREAESSQCKMEACSFSLPSSF